MNGRPPMNNPWSDQGNRVPQYAPRQQQPAQTPPKQGFNPKTVRLVIAVFFALLGLVLLVNAFTNNGNATEDIVVPAPTPIPVDAPGKITRDQAEQAGCLWSNGHAICDFPGGAQILRLYQSGQRTLGRALSDFNGSSVRPGEQVFDNCIITWDPTEAPEWRTQVDNCGERDMQKHGALRAIKPNLHPVVSLFMDDIIKKGGESSRLFGDLLTDVRCEGGSCSQWSQKVRFDWPDGATTLGQVRLAPLGLESLRPTEAPAPKTERRIVPFERNVALQWGIGSSMFVFLLALAAYLWARSYRPQTSSSSRRPTYRPRSR